MRRNPTSSEYVLWQAIRGGRWGVAFRRQVAIGRYIVDFLAPRERLVVEVDGGYHAERAAADRRRQRWLERQGYRVVSQVNEAAVSEVGKYFCRRPTVCSAGKTRVPLSRRS